MQKLFNFYFKSLFVFLILILTLSFSLFSCKSSSSNQYMILDFSLSKDFLQRIHSFAPVSILNNYMKNLCSSKDSSLTFNHSKYSSIKFIYSYTTSVETVDPNLSITEFLVDSDKTIEYLSYYSTPTNKFIDKDSGSLTIYKDSRKVVEENIYTTRQNIFPLKKKIKDIDSLCEVYNDKLQQLDKTTTILDAPESSFIIKIDDNSFKTSSYTFSVRKDYENMTVESFIATEGVLKDFGIKSSIVHEKNNGSNYDETIVLDSYEFK